jgi:glyoxylase-like metal-dependent hydrolase (beta-lactamase superfamily II)
MKYEILIVGPLETNCYIVYCQDSLECAIVDPGADADRIFLMIARKNLKPELILNTHGHIDHIGANKDVKEKYNIPLYLHSAVFPYISILLIALFWKMFSSLKWPFFWVQWILLLQIIC